ncbi:MAG: hypothetical protein LBE07_02610 [Gordonia sp. (in: high G+C Gram-positive bacteria)]|nr:hypothetical protein [Gordonia sp. (in: high G+C Gram-positive bacteria)]
MRHMPTQRLNHVRITLITLLAAVLTIPLVAGPAAAAPANAPIHATVEANKSDVVVHIADGSLSVESGSLVVRDAAGSVIETVPLTYLNTDKRSYPIDATVKGRTATLVPSTDVARSVTTPARVRNAAEIRQSVADQKQLCGPQTRKQRDLEALNRMNSELATATTIGGLAGAVIGAVVGLVGGPLAFAGAAIGVVAGVALGLGGAAISGTFTRYFDATHSKFKPKFCKVT